MLSPLAVRCTHAATAEEQARDPAYPGCFAAPGAPCRWGRRHDAITDPPWHTERLEAAAWTQPPAAQLPAEAVDHAALDSGLV